MTMKTYKPHKYQRQFHESKARFRTFIAGRRGGKSVTGTLEALSFAYGSDIKTGKPREVPTHGWIISPTYQMLKDVNTPLLLEWCPQDIIKDFNKSDNKLELVNGSTITLRSGENPDRLRGVGLDWIWLDEACFMSKAVWEVVYPTLTDRRGVAWVTTTPQGYDWVYDTFYKPAVNKEEGFEAWKFTTLDNPYIDKELVEKAKKDLSEIMFKQEYLASFEKFEGLIYPEFSEARHIRESEKALTDIYFIGLDVGWNHPSAGLLIKEDIQHNLFVVDEFREQYLTASDISNELRGLIARNGLREQDIQTYLIDPASKGTQQTSGQSMMFQLQEEGWPFVPANNDVMAGINRVTRLIRENRLFISKRCSKLIDEMNNYHWRKWDEEKDTDRAKPFKLGEDLVDSLRYVIHSRPDYFEHPKLDMYGRLEEEPEENEGEDSIEDMMSGDSIIDML